MSGTCLLGMELKTLNAWKVCLLRSRKFQIMTNCMQVSLQVAVQLSAILFNISKTIQIRRLHAKC